MTTTGTTWKSRTILFFLCLALAGAAAGLQAQSGNPPGSRFVFPRFLSAAAEATGLALFNPGPADARVELTLRSRDGLPVAGFPNPVAVTVPARGQIAKTAGELFATMAPFDASLEITSATTGLVAYYQRFATDGAHMDGADAPEAGTELIFPVIPGPAEGSGDIELHNNQPRSTAVELRLWNRSGVLLGKTTVQLPAGGTYRGHALAGFPGGLNLSEVSHITTVSRPQNIFMQAQPVMGSSVFSGFFAVAPGGLHPDMAVLNALTLSQTATAGVIPYFRIGEDRASILSLASVEPAAVEVTVTAVANDGSTFGSRKLSLPANGGYRAPIQQLLPATASGEKEGWLLLQSTGRIAGAVLFGPTRGAALSALPIQKTPKYEMTFPQLVQGSGFYTEVTVANPASATSHVNIYAVTPGGKTVGRDRVELGPGRRLSRRLDHMLPEAMGLVGGVVYVTSTEPVFSSVAVGNEAGSVLSSFIPQSSPVAFHPAPLTSFAVTGRVTLNGRPAPGFVVALSGPASGLAVTNADGLYAFANLPKGRYSMTVDQFGFEFIPGATNFEITTESRRQEFQGFTAPNSIVVQPSVLPAGSPATTVTIFGTDFTSLSQAFVGPVRLATTVVDPTQLKAVVPAYLLALPLRFEIHVATPTGGGAQRVTQPFPFVAFLDRPVLSGVVSQGLIAEGHPGTTLTLNGSGFLRGARVKVNGLGGDIEVEFHDDTRMLAFVPSRYFETGGIFPVTVENPYPSNIESNIQLLTVFHPAPGIEGIYPMSVPARLEGNEGDLNLDIFGYGFRRGAVVQFNGEPLSTRYCEHSAYCLATRLFARAPAGLLRESGFAEISVRNPDPSLAGSETLYLVIEGLQPTISSVLPGSATALDVPFKYDIPVIVGGTNFGPQTVARIYRAGATPPAFKDPVKVLSSTQLHLTLTVEYPGSLGEWLVEVANPPPGGGLSQPLSFFITEGTFVANPFLISMSPDVVPAGGQAFTLTLNGINFKSGAAVRFNTTLLPATLVGDGRLRAEVPASLIRNAGKVPVSVTNPDNGGTSNRLFLEIR